MGPRRRSAAYPRMAKNIGREKRGVGDAGGPIFMTDDED